MATIRFNKAHQLDNRTVKQEVQRLAEKLGDELDADYKWQGEKLVFKRRGADGFVELGEGELRIEIKLGMLLSPLKGKIESTVRDYLEKRLG